VACRVEQHVEFRLAQLLGGLDRHYERLDAGAGLPDRAANLTGLALECLWGSRDSTT
jgi:hypothetical protein